MRKLSLVLRILVGFLPIIHFSGAAQAEDDVTTLNFAVIRNGEQIGTSKVRLHRDGPQTTAEVATKVQVRIAYITVYRYEQTETQHWVHGKLIALNSTTDENGTVYKVNARRTADKLSVNANGKVSEIDAAVIPASVWNAELVRQRMALNTKNGSVMPISVVDHGKTQVVLQGRATTARHYSIKTTFPQDVWYDEQHRLLKVEQHGSDGSKIQFQPG